MCVESKPVRTFHRMVPIVMLSVASLNCGQATDDSLYATANNKLITIEIRDNNKVAITAVGLTGAQSCGAAIARAASGALYSLCGPGVLKPGPQQLATIDPKTGQTATVGKTVEGLQVMGLEFAPDGTLYAVGDANPASPTFNSLYTVDVASGEFTRVGSTGAPDFFMDFAFDRTGAMYGATGQALYTVDLKSGTASKVVDFVGGADIMGLSFNENQNKLYATDFKKPNATLYLVDIHTGFLTPLAATGYAYPHGLVPVNR